MKVTITQPAIHAAATRRRPITIFSIIFALAAAAAAQPPGGGFLPNSVQAVSTVPANGDVNPYGVAFVPVGFPGSSLNPGDILVSNFNNNQNLQGTGTTIVRITPAGKQSLFFQGNTRQRGLSTALGILNSGYVMVGSFPTEDGTCGTAEPGSLLVLSQNGSVLGAITGSGIDGPWDMTLYEQGPNVAAFISNALSGNIVRLDFALSPAGMQLEDSVIIASGYMHRCDPAALVVAPTGLVYEAATDTLFVASSEDNAVFAVPSARTTTQNQGTGTIVYQDATHLHGALAMAKAPNGDLLVSNNDVINGDPNQPSEIVEFTRNGEFVKELSVDPNQGGSFGLMTRLAGNNTAKFAAVDDNQNMLFVWTLPAH
ncbi:MAG TPA: hypothetical protein VMA31_11780 [Bryobacteraceae bacterium]|nr:hypothetical protein [Bryobacteraceae bacterium]